MIFEREDGRFDVQSVNAAGEREIHRGEGLSLKDAHEIAVVGAHEHAGRVLFAHHSDPDRSFCTTFQSSPLPILLQHFGHGLLQRFVLLTQFGDFTRGGLPLRISGQSFLFSLKKLLIPSVLPLRRPSTTARAPCWDRAISSTEPYQ